MRRRVIKRVHSIFRLELCLLTHTEEEEEKTERVGGGWGGLSLTQIAVIVSVPQASSQKVGVGCGGVKK